MLSGGPKSEQVLLNSANVRVEILKNARAKGFTIRGQSCEDSNSGFAFAS